MIKSWVFTVNHISSQKEQKKQAASITSSRYGRNNGENWCPKKWREWIKRLSKTKSITLPGNAFNSAQKQSIDTETKSNSKNCFLYRKSSLLSLRFMIHWMFHCCRLLAVVDNLQMMFLIKNRRSSIDVLQINFYEEQNTEKSSREQGGKIIFSTTAWNNKVSWELLRIEIFRNFSNF